MLATRYWLWYKSGVTEIPKKSFQDLEVGDSVISLFMAGWRPVAIVPEVIAQAWVFTSAEHAVISSKGLRADDAPMKDWERHLGIIVGTITAMPGSERLIMLRRGASDQYVLYLSDGDEGVREVKPE